MPPMAKAARHFSAAQSESRIHDPMQHGQEDGALDRKFEFPIGQ
jgi:hypothetical protein